MMEIGIPGMNIERTIITVELMQQLHLSALRVMSIKHS